MACFWKNPRLVKNDRIVLKIWHRVILIEIQIIGKIHIFIQTKKGGGLVDPNWPVFLKIPRSVKNNRIILKFGMGVPKLKSKLLVKYFFIQTKKMGFEGSLRITFWKNH